MKKKYWTWVPVGIVALFIGLSITDRRDGTREKESFGSERAPEMAVATMFTPKRPAPTPPNIPAPRPEPTINQNQAASLISRNVSVNNENEEGEEPSVVSDYKAWTAIAGEITMIDNGTYALRNGFAIVHRSGEWIMGNAAEMQFDKANARVEVDIPGHTMIERGSVTMSGDGVNILEQELENGETVRTTTFTQDVVVKTEQGEQVLAGGTVITEDSYGRMAMLASNATIRASGDEEATNP